MDETGLLYNMTPDKSLTTGRHIHGTKRSKQRITIALCCNATGTEKRKLVVIAKAAQPRCFKRNNFHAENYCTFYNNSKAWMTSSIFTNWILSFDRAMVAEGRKVLLLLDNATSHAEPKTLRNVKVLFLPPNTTSCLQPLDAGIIRAFKAYFRCHHLRHLIELYDDKKKVEMELHIAIRFAKLAWDAVTPTTINNCWKHTGILCHNEVTPSLDVNNLMNQDLHHLQTIMGIDNENYMSSSQFIDIDKVVSTEEMLSNELIVELVQGMLHLLSFKLL
jgi:hypothetical protein